MLYEIALVAGLVGSGITFAGLVASWAFGLIPILQHIHAGHRFTSVLAGVWLIGIALLFVGCTAACRYDQQHAAQVYHLDDNGFHREDPHATETRHN